MPLPVGAGWVALMLLGKLPGQAKPAQSPMARKNLESPVPVALGVPKTADWVFVKGPVDVPSWVAVTVPST